MLESTAFGSVPTLTEICESAILFGLVPSSAQQGHSVVQFLSFLPNPESKCVTRESKLALPFMFVCERYVYEKTNANVWKQEERRWGTIPGINNTHYNNKEAMRVIVMLHSSVSWIKDSENQDNANGENRKLCFALLCWCEKTETATVQKMNEGDESKNTNNNRNMKNECERRIIALYAHEVT